MVVHGGPAANVQCSKMKLLSNAGLEVVAPSENKDLSFSRLATLNTQP